MCGIKDTGYYYLFLSYGGLGVNDGYNIRVCRAREVTGPYEDALGQSMSDCRCKPWTFWNNDDIAPYGVKLMGGCQFAPIDGENSAKAAIIRSPGHNSGCYDAETGRWFLIHHTHFAPNGDRYIVQTREMWFNDDGWPVVAPTRYVADVPESELHLAGVFKVLSHEQDVNTEEHVSEALVAGKDFTTDLEEDGSAVITLDGMEYRGVCSVGYDEDQDAYATTFTAMSGEGRTLWGIRATGQED